MSRATVDLQAVRFFLGYGLIFFAQHVITIVGGHGRALRHRLAARARRARDHAAPRRSPPTATATSRTRCSATCSRSSARSRPSPRRTSSASTSSSRSRRSGRRREVPAPVERRSSQSVEANRQRALYVPLLAFLPLIAQAAVLLVGGRMVVDGTLSLGASSVQPLRDHARHAAAHARHVDRPGAAGDRLRRADLPGARRAEEVADRRRRRAPARPGRVRFEGVSFGYEPERPVSRTSTWRSSPGQRSR